MAELHSTTTEARASPGAGARWGGSFILGILIVALGFVALSASVITSLVSVMFYGGLLLGSGVFEIMLAFQQRKTGRSVPFLLAGVLSIVVGFLMLTRPMAGLMALTLLIAGFLFVNGLFRGLNALIERYPRWGWDLAYGAIAVVLGVMVIAQLPHASLWLLGTAVALEIIIRGVTLMTASLELRRRTRHPVIA